MMKTVALTCGYSTDTNIILVEEFIFLMEINIPNGIVDEDDFLWTEAHNILDNTPPKIGTNKQFRLPSGETIIGVLFEREVRQISKVSFKLKTPGSPFLQISKYQMVFKTKNDFLKYLEANEPDNTDSLLDIEMSNFFPS